MKKLILFCLIFPITIYAQRFLVRFANQGNNDYPPGWVKETFGPLPDSSNTVAIGWDTNWTLAQVEARDVFLKSQMDATNVLKIQIIDDGKRTRIQALADLFQDFQVYENGWQAGTNYTAAQMQVILRKHNGALLLMKPILKELYDARQ